MLLNFTMLVSLGVLAGLLLLIILMLIFRKVKKQGGGAIGFLIGFFLGPALSAFIIMYGNTNVYVVNGPGNYTKYAAYGTSDYKMSGKTIKIDSKAQTMLIINDSKSNLVLEEIIYGGFAFPSNHDIFAGETYASKEVYSIDYFFDDAPPESLSADAKTVKQYWLRVRRD